MFLLTMTMFMYAGMYILLKTDKNLMTDYEKRQVLRKAHL